jgi:hypothetical protein
MVPEGDQVRQAGATLADGAQVAQWRAGFERDLYAFARAILDMHWLSPALHAAVCRWLTRVPPYRKFLMMPRNHCKSTLIAQALPLHMLIQPAASNIYYERRAGSETRILLVGESETRAKDHLGVVASHLVGNELLRAFWPHVAWENPRRQARRWNSLEIDVPRAREWPDPTVRAIGVGTAVVGAHVSCLIKDDLTTEEAANSPTVMQAAIAWHENSRALFEHPDTDLEFITGTRWSVSDLPDIVMRDPTVESNARWRGILEDGRVIYPEKFGYEGAVEQLRAQHGVMFPLLYFNTVVDTELVDFDPADIREFTIAGDALAFESDRRDTELAQVMRRSAPPLPSPSIGPPVGASRRSGLELARRRVADILNLRN